MHRRPDALGIALLSALAAALMGGGFALIASGLVKPWELTAILTFGGVLAAAAHPKSGSTMPRNPHVHGAARPASEHETRQAARSEIREPRLDDREF